MNTYIKAFMKENDKTLRNIFGKYIKGNFLIDVKYLVIQMFPEINKYYNLEINMENMLLGINVGEMEYDLCRTIVGCHSSNSIFLEESERIKLERSQEYKKELAENVIEHVKLRRYASVFFRRKPIMQGEIFIAHNVPYNLFVMAMRMNQILREHQNDTSYRYFYNVISNKALSVLSLLEDNMLDSCYSICRVIIELCLKLIVFKEYPEILTKHDEFSYFELMQSCCEQKYSEEYNKCFKSRKQKGCKNKVEYLHYGWVDYIEDYHDVVKKQPYSINGILEFLSVKNKEESELYETLKIFYKMCNGYAHGNVANSKYPLLHYFEVTLILYCTILKTYFWVCDEFEIDTDIDSIDILAKTEKAGELLISQYNQRTTEKFEEHYKRFK